MKFPGAGIPVAVLLSVSMFQPLAAQETAAGSHDFGIFLNGFDPRPFPVVFPEPTENTIHAGYQTAFTVTNVSGEDVLVLFRFRAQDGPPQWDAAAARQ